MADTPAFNLSSVEQLAPRALVEAGGEGWATLAQAVRRLIDEMAAGAVLEIRSLEPSTRLDIPAWCASAGHEVVWATQDGTSTHFWIRKGAPSAAITLEDEEAGMPHEHGA